MKKLDKLLLINWHYFSYEMLEFKDINFLTGKNASGKTTIIDAIQLLILGDTTGHFFNKSASDKSSRSLKGYLRCEIGDQDDGSALYLRNGRFASYVAMQFYDDFYQTYFTIGIVFDNYEDGSYNGKFFCYDDKIPEHHFVQLNVPMDQKTLRLDFINRFPNLDVRFFESNQSYREFIKEKFGGLNNNFFSLFKKAIPFSPITNIETFITEYVCDVTHSIDVHGMQENIRHYKQLEIEATELSKRVDHLQEINAAFSNYQKEQETLQVSKYLLKRAELQALTKQVDEVEAQIIDWNNEVQDKREILTGCSSQLEEAKLKRDRLLKEKYSSDVYAQQKQLEADRERLQKQRQSLEQRLQMLHYSLKELTQHWKDHLTGYRQYFLELNDETSLAEIDALEQTLPIPSSQGYFELSEKELLALQRAMNTFQERVRVLSYETQSRLKLLRDELLSLENERQQIASGAKPYDTRFLDFKNAIEKALAEKYHAPITVQFLADCMDIRDESWRVALETYLNTQRFYLMVDPKYVDAAIEVYDDLRKSMRISEFGIVDTQKVTRSTFSVKKGSIYEELTFNNDAASAYLATLLGSLMKCDDLSHLRDNPRSITRNGMLYQNFVARQLNTTNMRSYIGFQSLSSDVSFIENQLNELKNEHDVRREDLEFYQNIMQLEALSTNDIRSFIQGNGNQESLKQMDEQIQALNDTLSSLSTNYLDTLNRRIHEVEDLVLELETEKDELQRDVFDADANLKRMKSESLPQLVANQKHNQEEIQRLFDQSWALTIAEPAFVNALEQYGNASTILSTIKPYVDRTQSRLTELWKQLVQSRTRYSALFQANNDVNALHNDFYDSEYYNLGTVKLTQYQEKIRLAKEQAMNQFQNDFLAKLKANFDMVISQIEALNDALLHSKFGTDSYRFVVTPRPEFRPYYEMINDPMLLSGQDIASEPFQQKYGTTIEDLFRQITFVDNNTDMRSELEQNIAKFTDYRSYLKFDLIVSDSHGRKQHLSRTLLKKSGGETQTPFYISVLASFAQAYRVYSSNERYSSIRLIIFDEAFSKMDSDRIQESVKLLRGFGLQAILSAPPEKMADIAPLVDRTLCVVRSNTMSTVKDFNYAE